MKLVTFLQRPVELLRKRGCNRRLAAARHANDDEDFRASAMSAWPGGIALRAASTGVVLMTHAYKAL
jgi:hypothetical protein